MKTIVQILAAATAAVALFVVATSEYVPTDSFATDSFISRMDSTVTADSLEMARLGLAGEMQRFAEKYLGRRYRWGATGPKSFDCSGFTSHIFKNFGMNLNRTSRAQYTQGESVDMEDIRPGDLLFFSGPRKGKTVGHVAMVTSVDPDTGKMEFIHASSSKGITYQSFPDNGYFSKRYLGARRILGTEGFELSASTS